jgi:DNA-binding NarL/FixJ family response regulator
MSLPRSTTSQRHGVAPCTAPLAAPARVAVVSDAQLYLAAVVQGLASSDRVEVTASATTGEQLVAALRGAPADVALVDVAMPASLGVVHALRRALPGLRVVGFGVAGRAHAAAYAAAGVAASVPREGSVDDLVSAVERAMQADVPRPAAPPARADAPLAAAPLTPREAEIVALIDRGLSNKEIAELLAIEPATVKNHVHNVLEKLRVRRRGAAAAAVRRTLAAPHDSTADAATAIC